MFWKIAIPWMFKEILETIFKKITQYLNFIVSNILVSENMNTYKYLKGNESYNITPHFTLLPNC